MYVVVRLIFRTCHSQSISASIFYDRYVEGMLQEYTYEGAMYVGFGLLMLLCAKLRRGQAKEQFLHTTLPFRTSGSVVIISSLLSCLLYTVLICLIWARV